MLECLRALVSNGEEVALQSLVPRSARGRLLGEGESEFRVGSMVEEGKAEDGELGHIPVNITCVLLKYVRRT